jgi:hypothetical protein
MFNTTGVCGLRAVTTGSPSEQVSSPEDENEANLQSDDLKNQ